jgi:RHS repeat-associated protein
LIAANPIVKFTSYVLTSETTLKADRHSASACRTSLRAFVERIDAAGDGDPGAIYAWLAGRCPDSFAIRAKATDNLGVVTTGAPVTVQVVDNVPPTVSMLARPTDATAPATVSLNAAASDADGSVAKVDFFHGSTLLASVTQAPYAYNWMNVAAGSYTITAKAPDDRGAVTLSDPVTVTVTAMPAAAQVYYIDSDHVNTPRVITDASNRIVWQWDNSDPFGGNVPQEDPGNTGTRIEFNLRFPGQYFDRETNLHYNCFRKYDPNIGRYIESDPIGLDWKVASMRMPMPAAIRFKT